MEDRYPHDFTAFTEDYISVSSTSTESIRKRPNGDRTPALDVTNLSDLKQRHTIEALIGVYEAYKSTIKSIVDRLTLKLSVLCICDKEMSKPLIDWISIELTMRHFMPMPVTSAEGTLTVNGLVENLYSKLRAAVGTEYAVVILKHLDLMTTTLGGDPSTRASDLVLWLNEARSVPVLAFADPELPLPKIIEDLFAETIVLPAIARDQLYRLLMPEEVPYFSADSGYVLTIADQLRLFQYVSGLNPVRMRTLIRLTVSSAKREGWGDIDRVYGQIRDLTTLGELQVAITQEKEIAGYEAVKADLKKRVITPVRRRQKATTTEALQRADYLIPKGVILHGPPRNGKTEIAKWLAAELNAPIIVIRGPELKNKWVGETEHAIRRIFARARKAAPSVILIDEMDALTPTRDTLVSGPDSSMVAMFLTEMDGMSKDESVLVIGTTNRLEAVDPAFRAPGRFGVIVHIPYPELCSERLAILRLYKEKMQLVELSEESIQYLGLKTGVENNQDAVGFLDQKAEINKKRWRDAFAEAAYKSDFRRNAGPAFESDLDERFKIGRGPRWSCAHLQELCNCIASEVESLLESGKKYVEVEAEINRSEFLDEVFDRVRGDTPTSASINGHDGLPHFNFIPRPQGD